MSVERRLGRGRRRRERREGEKGERREGDEEGGKWDPKGTEKGRMRAARS